MINGADAWIVIALAAAGTVVGDHAWYLLGRLTGRRLFERYCRTVHLSQGRIAAADRFVRRFGGLALVIGRRAAALRIVVTPLAVSHGMSYGRFLVFDFLGAVLWLLGFVCWAGLRAPRAPGTSWALSRSWASLESESILVSVMTQHWLTRRASVS